MTSADVTHQERFPALQKTDQVYFDNAGGSQVLDTVIESIRDYLTDHNVQLGASYAVGQKSTACYMRAFDDAAAFVNANADEVAFGSSTTQLLRNLSYTLKFKPGDEIVISAIDHEANIAPWVDLADRQQLVIKWWKPGDAFNPELRAKDLEKLLSPKTKLVACTHASNILGSVTDVREISNLAHSVGAMVCVDGVAYAPHLPVDVKALDVDFYVFSWYKVFGPHVATLYASWSAQTQMRSLGHFFNAHASLVDKIGLGGGSYELCQSVSSVVSYLNNNGKPLWDDMRSHETKLTRLLVDELKKLPTVTLYGCDGSAEKLPIVSFSVKGRSSKEIVEAVDKASEYAIRWGAFYSNRLVRGTLRLNGDGVVRVSMAHYNTGKLHRARILFYIC